MTYPEGVCCPSYPACAVFYCHLWPVRLYSIFTHYLINGTIFFFGGGGVLKHKMYVDFLYNFCMKCISFYEELVQILSYIKFNDNPSS